MKLHRVWLRRLVPPTVLNRVNRLSHLEDSLFDIEARRVHVAQLVFRTCHGNLFADAGGPEFQLFSQNGEDGILVWLLQQTGAPVKTFVEIGIQNGLECNTAMLAFVFGWDGLMLDADPLGVAAARALTHRLLRGRPNRVEVRQELVARETVNRIVAGPDLGVLSIDVDGMDYWLWKAVEDARPDIVVIEYNASLGPLESITVPYTAGFSVSKAHPSGYYHGASLAALEKLGRRKQYALVAVDSAGVNAFFVREQIRPASLLPRSAVELFRPHRMRACVHSPEQQWALIRHLPYEHV